MSVADRTIPGSDRELTDLDGDLVQPGHPLFGLIWANPERMSGVPCFAGTRVPVTHLFEHLEGDVPLDEFLADFPGVTREQVVRVLELSQARLTDGLVGG